MAVAHLAFEFGPRHQRGDAVHDQHVDRAGAHQRVADLERLLAAVRLAEQQVVDVDAELAGVDRVERVLGIDEGAGAARLLRLGDRVQRQGRLARAFRAVNLDDAPRGRPPMPSARSRPSEPDGITSICWSPRCRAPMRMMQPLPKARSIWVSAASSALFFSIVSFLFDNGVPPTHDRTRLRWTAS